MTNKKVLVKFLGIVTAMAGAVIIIHTVPIFIWYYLLAGLALIIGFLLLFLR